MELLKQHFSQGVRNIITGHSPGEDSGECNDFSSSTHPQRELCYVMDGNSRYMLNGKIFEAVPGTFFLIDHWEPHEHILHEHRVQATVHGQQIVVVVQCQGYSQLQQAKERDMVRLLLSGCENHT